MVEITMLEIALTAEITLTIIVLTIETVLTVETVTPTLITAEHRLHSPTEIATHQQEAILKDNPETIIINTIEQTRHQVKTTNVPQIAIHQAITPTEVAEAACLAEVVVTEHPEEVECLAEAEECPEAAEAEDDNKILKIN